MNLIHVMTAALTLASASPVSGANDGQIIGKNQITLTGDRLTPEALWAMGRIGTFAVSPDAQKIVYTVSYYSVQQNKSHTVLYLMDADGANPTLLTTTADNESEPAFTPDGQKITFLSSNSGSSQIWEMALDGTSRRQVSFCHKDVEGYKFSPDGKKVIIVHSVDTYTSIEKKYDDLPLSSGMVITDLNYKHWDRYVTTIPHIFVADVQDGRAGDGIDLLNGEPFECPMLPFGGSEQFNWSPDSRYIVYTSRKKTGRDYAISTDSDIYRYDTATGQTENLCKPADYKEPEIDPSRSMEHQAINHFDDRRHPRNELRPRRGGSRDLYGKRPRRGGWPRQRGARQRPQRGHPRVRRGMWRLSSHFCALLRVFAQRGSFSCRKFSCIKPAHFSR